MQVFDHVTGGRGPDLELHPSVVQLGALAAGQSDSRVVVVVRNRGDLPLTVHDVVGGPGVTVDTTCFEVEPGGAVAVEVTLNASSADPIDTGLKFCSDDPDQGERTLALTANNPGLGVGDPAPSFELRDTEGNLWSTERLRGNIAVLADFATF